MKNIIKILLLSTLFLFVVGNLKSQVTSDNGEFTYDYISEYTLVTGLGDTINTGQKMPRGISNEGHPYSVGKYGGKQIMAYYSDPWVATNTIFVEYNRDGSLKQSLLFYENKKELTYAYCSRNSNKVGVIKDNYKKAFSLWEY